MGSDGDRFNASCNCSSRVMSFKTVNGQENFKPLSFQMNLISLTRVIPLMSATQRTSPEVRRCAISTQTQTTLK